MTTAVPEHESVAVLGAAVRSRQSLVFVTDNPYQQQHIAALSLDLLALGTHGPDMRFGFLDYIIVTTNQSGSLAYLIIRKGAHPDLHAVVGRYFPQTVGNFTGNRDLIALSDRPERLARVLSALDAGDISTVRKDRPNTRRFRCK